ncbi:MULTISPECIES: O-antigen ligase family protein [Pseudoalteromonas]|uniref:Membrane protein n=1 Tax=Pseudoalteromonas fuliginea TaxID=1872678 RepID=A0ABD3Y760_9GAMM|nr:MULTISPECIES: O-antigen ligase family protein [Pseudoalteromonas]KAA1152846.1 oligosaccharide repeat unit polymerase [Pseudoalteromonas fuliginea]KAA1166450.1 oligosaccharide repeat unit polymerase [Pseudoalteromonas fuliginea]KDC50131.1 membrane protein [Pseudoalteromonas fuliginea]KDC55930.1 membrane protein [Pseudoalteromonas sp. S3431]KJZ27235.1 membrane protein [Pseudoalteromonas fuliginea]
MINWYKKHCLIINGLLITALTLVLYILFGPIAAFALLLLPFAGYLAVKISTVFIIFFILFSYFRLHEAFVFLMPLKIPKMLALASLLGITWHLFISKTLKPHWSSTHLIFVIWFAWLTVCVFSATNKGLAIEYWIGVLVKVFIMVFAISWWLTRFSHFSFVRMGIMISGVAVALVALNNKINGIGLIEGTRVTISREYRSQLGDPNDLSLVLMFPVSFLAAELFNSQVNKYRRIFAGIGLIFTISGVIATQSRGGVLGIAAILSFFLYQKVKNPVVVAMCAGVAMLAMMVFAGISDRQSGGAAEDGVDESAMGRIYAWQAAINMALSNPLTGVGVDNFFVNYYFYSPHWDGKNHAVHSTWFQVLGETGFVGICIFLVLIASIYRSLSRVYCINKLNYNHQVVVNANALKAGIIGFMVAGTFLTQAFTWPLYIILALTIALEKLTIQSNKES